jgi:hypothetical protein
MKKVIIIAIVVLVAAPLTAQDLYRWTDEKGTLHFGDSPPPDNIPESNIVSEPATSVNGKKDGNRIVVDIYKDFFYEESGWPFGMSVGQTRAAGMSPDPYEYLSREPSYKSSRVLYGYIALGNSDNNHFNFALDGVGTTDWKLYVDKNNNKDLTDDGAPYINEGTGKFAALISLEFEVINSKRQTILQPYKLWFWINENKQGQKSPYFYARCHYAGQLTIDGTSHDSIAFEEKNHDGLFKESGLCIDMNDDKQCDKSEQFYDGDTIKTENSRYLLKLDYP